MKNFDIDAFLDNSFKKFEKKRKMKIKWKLKKKEQIIYFQI